MHTPCQTELENLSQCITKITWAKGKDQIEKIKIFFLFRLLEQQ